MAANLMPAPSPPEGGGTYPKLADFLGQIVVLGPTEEVEVDTSYKPGTKATRCVGWAWVGQRLVDLGDVLVFWGKVRAQLHEAIDTGAYIVGRIVKDGRSYALDPVTTEATLAAIGRALDF